jgi:hypothetical protein
VRIYLAARVCICIALFGVLSSSPGFGQGENSRIEGVVTDPSGAVIPEVTITAINTQTQLKQIVTTDVSGVYSISPLPPGIYQLTAEHAGFQRYVENVTLTVSQEVTINFQLKVGKQTNTVTVNAGTILINNTNAEVSNVVDEHTIKELPLNGRDPSSLILLSPGVMNLMNTSIAMYPGSNNFLDEQGASAGGGQQGSDYALLDGVQNMDLYYNLTAPFPNADATQEFRAITSNFGAEYGFSSNAVISVDTKSGANSFHGGLFEFFRNGDLNATNWFSGAGNPLKRNQFGAYLGGPIRKDKFFFFANYQGTRQSITQGTITEFTPTAAMLTGDFSAVPVTLGPPFTTVNGKPNQVDPSLLSPAAIQIAHDMLPLGQIPSTGQVTFGGPPVITDTDEATARLDYTISDKQRVFVRSFIQDFNMPVAAVNGNGLSASDAQSGQYYNEIVSHTWLPTTSLVNVLTAAWIRLAVDNGNVLYTNEGKPFCLSEYINIATAGCYMQGPTVNNGFYMVTDEPNDDSRVTWELVDHITKIVGKNVITAGGNVMHQWLNTTTNYPAPGVINFSGYATGFGLADYVLGDAGSFYQGALENSPSEQWQMAFYGEDQYKATPNVTVTVGLRWEPDFAAVSLESGSAFVPGQQSQRYPQAPTGMIFPGDPGLNMALRPSNLNYYEPRVGIAWQVDSKTVLRAGFGIFVAPLESAQINEAVGVAPFSPFFNFVATPSSPISFENPWAGFAVTGGKSPFPPFTQNPNIPASEAIFLTPVTIFDSFSRNFHLPVTQSWTASVERQFNRTLAAHIAYVGNQSYHQTVNVDQNPGIYANGGNRTLYPDFSTIFENQSIGTASYNSLQASIEEQPWKGLQFHSSFTWSKVIDTQGLNDSAFFSAGLPNPFNIRFNRGIAEMSIPLISITDFVYDAPLLTGHSNLLRQTVGGWEISGIWTLQSGFPFGIVGGDGNNNSEALQGQDRGDIVPGVPWNVHRGNKAHWLTTYFNPAAFTVNQPGTFGDTGKNFLNGPGINTEDIAFMKNWHFGERNLQFRCEMFNAFNHPDFGQPDNDPSTSNAGQITSIGPIPPRIIQLGVKFAF